MFSSDKKGEEASIELQLQDLAAGSQEWNSINTEENKMEV